LNLNYLDWTIIGVAIVALRLFSLSTRQYMHGVADFLSANRSAGRYLLTIATQMGSVGVVTFVGAFEMIYSAGLPPRWWELMGIPGGVIILLTGWVYYRFRETRAMTMAQFFEMRYSRRFRIFAGILCWTSGILNFGIFPAVAARFIIYFCGLPETFSVPGLPFDVSTFAAVMAVDLALAVSFVTMGGQVSVMITDCAQGIFCAVAFVVISFALITLVSWEQMTQALSLAPANSSMINPFKTGHVEEFNIFYFLIGIFGSYYGYMSWQGSQGFYSSAKTPHEQKMGGIIALWRYVPQALLMLLLPLAGLAVMKLPEFSAQAEMVNQSLKAIPNEYVQGQMRVPIAMAHLLPYGIKGLLATVMIFISFTCHDTYMHSWGSIFIQDVVMPLRRKPLTPEQHIRLLRWSVIGVALFAFLFSMYYPMGQKILFFFAITGTIWLGGSGAAIIGGLYWRRGTTAGAYAALTVGAVLGLAGLIVPQAYQSAHGRPFPINGQVLWFIAMISAALAYTGVSLVTGRGKPLFNLERMLHRGRYRIAGDHEQMQEAPKSLWLRITGITPEFSRTDTILAVALVVYYAANVLWFAIFSLVNLFYPISDAAWAKWWLFDIRFKLAISLPAVVWFAIGGIMDMKALYRTLGTAHRDPTDDGSVRQHEDAALEGEPEAIEAGVN
jgi:SSS family solute:Na+ symporter